MSGKAIIIGNSDGIGWATTRVLLERGWKIVGVSRSASPIEDPACAHIVAEVQTDAYLTRLKSVLQKEVPVDLCLFCAGIGKMLNLTDMDKEAEIIRVNQQVDNKLFTKLSVSNFKRGSF